MPRAILIASPSQLGDALFAFPVAAILRRHFPQSRLYFCSTAYTRPLVDACEHLDGFIELDALLCDPRILAPLGIDVLLNLQSDHRIAHAGREAGIGVRVTNLRRLKGHRDSNRFLLYSRSNARVHTIALNLRMLRALQVPDALRKEDWPDQFGLTRIPALPDQWAGLKDPRRFTVVLHPKSGGHGREWPAGHYLKLVEILPPDRFQIFLTGSRHEAESLRAEAPGLFRHAHVNNLMGRFSLPAFLGFLKTVDGFVASGTGPLHIAAALGRRALGVFPPRRNMDAGKWSPVGPLVETLTGAGTCGYWSWGCRDQADGPPCPCTAAILPDRVAARLAAWADAAGPLRAVARSPPPQVQDGAAPWARSRHG